MALSDLTVEAVLQAIEECDERGPEAFRALYGFGSARTYFLIHEGIEYDSKAVAGVVSATGTAEDPCAYGEQVARRFCPNILPYELGTPAVFGFAKWNGRSLTDNAPNVMFSIAANTPVSLGIGKESVTPKPSKTFPYVPSVP